MDGSVANPEFSGDLCDGLPTGLGEPHRFFFEFSRIGLLNLCHDDPFPDLLEYISALVTLPNRGMLIYLFPIPASGTPPLRQLLQSLGDLQKKSSNPCVGLASSLGAECPPEAAVLAQPL